MPTPYLQGTGTVPEATALQLRGVQTDAYGEILGGHKAVFDPLQSGLTGRPGSGVSLPNLIAGGSAFVTEGDFAATGVVAIETAKGLNFAGGGQSGDTLRLPAVFDLNTLGSEPSVVIAAWLTPEDVSASLNSIVGYAYQSGSECQWMLAQDNTAGSLRAGGLGMNSWVYIPVTVNVPVLVTMHIRRTGSGAYACDVYKDEALIGSVSRTYPFATPVTGSPAPRAGLSTGWGENWDGTIHRLQLIKVAADFDIEAWLAAEIAANASRWA